MAELTVTALQEILKHCLFEEDECPRENGEVQIPKDAVLVDGIVNKYAFHPGRIEEKRAAIQALLAETPDEFHTAKGGGMSFLRLCMDRHGNHWGEHVNMEGLIALAIATNQGRYCLPREYWQRLPGSVPYVMFDVENSTEGMPDDQS